MALIKCKECGKEISSNAPTCPHCGTVRFAQPKKTSGCAIAAAVLVGVPVLIGIFASSTYKSPAPIPQTRPTTNAPAQPSSDAAAIGQEFAKSGGAWQFSETKDAMTGKPNIVLATPATRFAKDKFGRNVTATLLVQCRENRTGLVVSLSDFISTQSVPVSSRIDQQAAQTRTWDISSDYQGVFAPSPIPTIKALATAEMFTARLTPHGESPMDFPFVVTGLGVHLPKVRAACNW